jgi:release factor glutamine methyltransferase
VLDIEDVDRVVARLRAAGCVYAEDEAALLVTEAPDDGALEALVARRVAGEPLEYLLGWAEFAGLRIVVDPGVFVPRRRTELLVTEALRLLAGRVGDGPPPVVVDLCCGSGALGAAVASQMDVELYAADIDPVAVRCARRNVDPLGGVVVLGDLVEPLPPALRGTVDVLLANVPYVPTDGIATMPPEARDHEARVALDGGADGLDVLRRVAALAPSWLAPGGTVLMEVGERQVDAAVAALDAAGLAPRVLRDPDLGATALAATRPGPSTT